MSKSKPSQTVTKQNQLLIFLNRVDALLVELAKHYCRAKALCGRCPRQVNCPSAGGIK